MIKPPADQEHGKAEERPGDKDKVSGQSFSLPWPLGMLPKISKDMDVRIAWLELQITLIMLLAAGMIFFTFKRSYQVLFRFVPFPYSGIFATVVGFLFYACFCSRGSKRNSAINRPFAELASKVKKVLHLRFIVCSLESTTSYGCTISLISLGIYCSPNWCRRSPTSISIYWSRIRCGMHASSIKQHHRIFVHPVIISISRF